MMWLNIISGLHNLSRILIGLTINNYFTHSEVFGVFLAVKKPTTSRPYCSELWVIISIKSAPKWTLWKSAESPLEASCGLVELWIWTALSTPRVPGYVPTKFYESSSVVKSEHLDSA